VARFSAPIAATRLAGGNLLVAGLVVPDGVIRLASLRPDRATEWTADALRGLVWAADADLRAYPAADGAAIVWRGVRDGKSGRTLALVGPRGESRGDPIDVGASLCTTADEIAWLEGRSGSTVRVRARRWTDATAREAATIAPDRDPALVCGDHVVFVLADGDDDVTAAAITAGAASTRAPMTAIHDADFGDDEEREHEVYAVGDDLGLVRIGTSGAIAMREIVQGTLGAWRKLKHKLGPDDDVVALDGDASATLVVYTRDESDKCPAVGASSESVHALRVDRKTGDETVLEVAPAECGKAVGPFWVATPGGALAAAWVERARKAQATSAPISALAYRASAGVTRIDQPADALVDAGCNAGACFAAALVREPGSDGMAPESIRVLRYP
jgi:hypothetical protein